MGISAIALVFRGNGVVGVTPVPSRTTPNSRIKRCSQSAEAQTWAAAISQSSLEVLLTHAEALLHRERTESEESVNEDTAGIALINSTKQKAAISTVR